MVIRGVEEAPGGKNEASKMGPIPFSHPSIYFPPVMATLRKGKLVSNQSPSTFRISFSQPAKFFALCCMLFVKRKICGKVQKPRAELVLPLVPSSLC